MSAITSTVIVAGLLHPWALAFMPGGDMLVTEIGGTMKGVTLEGAKYEILGLPFIYAGGGLLDVVHLEDRHIAFCYARGTEESSHIAVMTATLDRNRLDNFSIVFTQTPLEHVRDTGWGCRLALQGNYLFAALGQRRHSRGELSNMPKGSFHQFEADLNDEGDYASRLDNTLGKIVRIDLATKAWTIHSYGHRNPEGLAFNPADGRLWETEHGPRGGDELNIIYGGRNYGWPYYGLGTRWDGEIIHKNTHANGIEQPRFAWTPAIAPSGLTFYTGKLFPQWRNSLFVGSLKGKKLIRMSVAYDAVIENEEIPIGARVRDVREGPDGALYVLTDEDDGKLIRISPGRE